MGKRKAMACAMVFFLSSVCRYTCKFDGNIICRYIIFKCFTIDAVSIGAFPSVPTGSVVIATRSESVNVETPLPFFAVNKKNRPYNNFICSQTVDKALLLQGFAIVGTAFLI